MELVIEILGYVANGLFNWFEFEGGFWVTVAKAILSGFVKS